MLAPYDLLITNARIIDGTGAPAANGDVAIVGPRIVRVSAQPLPRDSALRVIDARGHVLSPGFIDMHAHLEPLITMPDAQSAARQRRRPERHVVLRRRLRAARLRQG